VVELLEPGGDQAGAGSEFREHLNKVLIRLLKELEQQGTMRGLIGAAALSLLAVAGAEVGWIASTLVATSITRPSLAKLKALIHWPKKDHTDSDTA